MDQKIVSHTVQATVILNTRRILSLFISRKKLKPDTAPPARSKWKSLGFKVNLEDESQKKQHFSL